MMRNIKCKGCANLKNDWCNKKNDSPDPELVRDCRCYLQMTNADRIRGMTDDELAEWIRNGIFRSDVCDYCDYNNGYCDGSPCRRKAEADIIVKWLQKPYKENEDE